MTTVYVSIGNSDDNLTQREWAEFVSLVDAEIQARANVHGAWFSIPIAPWQNACWCAGFTDAESVRVARKNVTAIREHFRQDSVAWAVAETEFI
jgi:hypothetical protein